MSDLDTRLQQALRAEAAPPRDPLFRIEIMLRRERKALRGRMLTSGAMVLTAAILAPFGLAAIDELFAPGYSRLLADALAAAALLAAIAAPLLPLRLPRLLR
jgi:hypothetical protein